MSGRIAQPVEHLTQEPEASPGFDKLSGHILFVSPSLIQEEQLSVTGVCARSTG